MSYTVAVLKLDTPLGDLRGIGQKFLKHLARLKIATIRDLIFHFPFRYEDFSQIYPISDLEPGQQATIQGVIQQIEARRSFRKRLLIVEALIRDETGSLRAVWFNQPFVKNILRPGRLVNLSGKISLDENELYLSSPTYELIGRHETTHTARLVPIYPETRGLTSKGLRFIIKPILENLEELPEWMPEEILESEKLPELNHAIYHMHFPETIEDAARAKRRFVFEDLFLLQLFNLRQKLKLKKEKGLVIKTNLDTVRAMLERLPFKLTESQKRSLWDIIKDLEKPMPMNRLLQGDVGSGKTVVAALVARIAVENGYQTAFMAPTEVLARQHFETLKALLERIGEMPHDGPELTVGFLASGETRLFYGANLESRVTKSELIRKIESGEVSIVIGTHALLQKSVSFKNLGLVIVDEQHRFGVEQRASLIGGTREARCIPHFLSMSATPIPRTLMLAVFGDLDISTINELPSGRKPIVTKIVDTKNRDKAYAFIRGEVRKGRQAFVICPRIEPNTNEEIDATSSWHELQHLELKSVKEEYEKLSKKIFPDLKIAMLHGQMKPKEKDAVMAAFKNRDYDVLISTSVVEVGVDVPNATVMMIEGSDRFGLAQLYQFRGRVGRSAHQSFCLLFTDSDSESTRKRLKAILESKNGFELAEKDLELRGPGQFLGTEQTGLPDLAMRGLQDIELVKASRSAALRIVQKDSKFNGAPALKKKIDGFAETLHRE